MNRNTVYAIIDNERDYQDEKWGNPEHDKSETVGNFLIYIDRYLSKAKTDYTKESDLRDQDTLDEIRKIAALAVACMELYGARTRV